jgi:hypothetical protein
MPPAQPRPATAAGVLVSIIYGILDIRAGASGRSACSAC